MTDLDQAIAGQREEFAGLDLHVGRNAELVDRITDLLREAPEHRRTFAKLVPVAEPLRRRLLVLAAALGRFSAFVGGKDDSR